MFLRRGFHGASLDEIAEEAGYTKGAVYSYFEGKDGLFLAVLDDQFQRRAAQYVGIVFDHADIKDSYRAVARFWRDANEREPEWGRPDRRVLRPRVAHRVAAHRRARGA